MKNLEYIEIEPKTSAEYSVIWLHGLGADGHDFEPIVPELKLPADKPFRFIFPHAPVQPVTLNNGYAMRAWYDLYGMDLKREDIEGMRASQKAIMQLIDREIARGIPANHIFLAGFSQGAAVALFTGLQTPCPLAGIFALSGYLPGITNFPKDYDKLNKQTRIFIAHGTVDPVVPAILGETGARLLQEQNFSVTWHTYPMEHQVCQQEISDIREWFLKIVEN